MDIAKVRELINLYKDYLPQVHQAEIYKWRITKHFQDRWDIEANDFYEMLAASLATSTNLLASGNYFARRMLLLNAAQNPDEVRQLFVELFNEEQNLLERIHVFRDVFREINERNFPGKMAYQDDRAIMVYLSLRYPDIYYLYKYTMFRDFVALVDYPYRPIMGRSENVTEYLTLCNLLNEEIRSDYELLEMHRTRIGEAEFADPEHHILTQDVIYAATFHLPRIRSAAARPDAVERLRKVPTPSASLGAYDPGLKGRFTNYIELEREKKRIGDLGELLVLEREQERLKNLGIGKEPIHKSKTEGDGLGYDILSFDDRARERYIEVKTTTGSLETPFFITASELARSVQDRERFVLYRLFDFDIATMTAKYCEINGELSTLCTNPVSFRVSLA